MLTMDLEKTSKVNPVYSFLCHIKLCWQGPFYLTNAWYVAHQFCFAHYQRKYILSKIHAGYKEGLFYQCLVVSFVPLSLYFVYLLDLGRQNTIEYWKRWFCFWIIESFICSESFISCKKDELFLTSCSNNTWYFGFRHRRHLPPTLFSYYVLSLLFRTAVRTPV